jgi:hypothetical protein
VVERAPLASLARPLHHRLAPGSSVAESLRVAGTRSDTVRYARTRAGGARRDTLRADGARRDTASSSSRVRVVGTHRDSTRTALVRRDTVTTRGVHTRSAHPDSGLVRRAAPRADSLAPAKHPLRRRVTPPQARPDSARADSAHGGP